MIENEKLTAAAHPLELGGDVYRVAPLVERQYDEINLWVRAQHVKVATLAAGELPTKLGNRAIAVAIKQSHRMVWTDSDCQPIIMEEKGLAYLLWQSMLKSHPNATVQDARKILRKGNRDQNILAFLQKFREINSVRGKNENAPAENEPAGQESPAKPTSTES